MHSPCHTALMHDKSYLLIIYQHIIFEETTDPEIIKLVLDETKVNFLTKRLFDKERILSLDIALDASLRNQNQKLFEVTIKKLEETQKEYPLETALSIYFEQVNHEKNMYRNIALTTGMASAYNFWWCYYIKKNYAQLSQRYFNLNDAFLESAGYGTNLFNRMHYCECPKEKKSTQTYLKNFSLLRAC